MFVQVRSSWETLIVFCPVITFKALTLLQPSGNIKKLIITKEANQSACVKGLMSAEGETLDLIRVLRVRGNVEVWMGLVETAMFEVRRRRLEEDYN